jgi:hypothetical protein
MISTRMLIAISVLAAACSAGGSPSAVSDRFDASPAPPLPAPDASGVDSGSGITWTDLYRDFFGPTSVASCKGNGTCHGTAAEGGGGVWVCGDTQLSCYTGMTATAAALIDTKNPASSTLLGVGLRSASGGNMPLTPASYVFSDASIKRISAWMAAGAQNN